MEKNVQRKPGFKQVCVWPATVVGVDKADEFEEFMLDNFKVRVQYLEEIETFPDMHNGIQVPETGGRNDLFFAVHGDDVGKFAIPRLQAGIRWIEDVLASCNYHCKIYDERVHDYKSW